MVSVQTYITETVFADSAGEAGMIPEDRIVATCRTAGFDPATVEDGLATLVEAGRLREDRGRYGPVEGETLDVVTHYGNESKPWQFSVRRTDEAVVVTQARGPADEFDPVVKRFAVEERSLAAGAVEFRSSAVRRVWSEDPDRPGMRSRRSEARHVEFLYRDRDGWHLVRPDPETARFGLVDTSGHEPTGHPGVTVSSTFLRAETGTDLRFSEERTYRVTEAVLDAYGAAYVLVYHELDEESARADRWEVDDATAHRLVAE